MTIDLHERNNMKFLRNEAGHFAYIGGYIQHITYTACGSYIFNKSSNQEFVQYINVTSKNALKTYQYIFRTEVVS